MACKEYQTHSRDSYLTFAVVWDPETGLETYSGCDLMCRSLIPEEYDFPESISQIDDESVVFCDTCSVSGRTKTQFIDPHPPCVYERYISSKSTANTSLSQTENSPKALVSPSTSTRPSSKWTFAALWDPKTGLSTFTHGKLAKFIPSSKHRIWPSSPTSGSAPNTEHHSIGYIDNIKRGFYLRVLPELGSHNTASSSPVGGGQYEPHFSCFDPLNEWLLFDPHLLPFPQSASGPTKKGNHLLGIASMNDAYVMKGDDFNHTCLPSRFSASTTSTTGYVPINPSSVHDIPPITFLGSRSAASRKRGKLLRSKPASLQHETETGGCAIPRLFKNAPWSKGSEADKWVLVEVQSVVTDRVVDEL